MLGVSAALQKHSIGADSRNSKTHSLESLHNWPEMLFTSGYGTE